MEHSSKIKLLIVGIIMNCAGTEKSFLAFANTIDYDRYDVTLLLARREGKLIDKIPPQIRVITIDERYADMFKLSGANAVGTIMHCIVRHHPLALLRMLPYVVRILAAGSKEKRSGPATELWCSMMRYMPQLDEEYDVCAAYWGDRTMFYMCDKVKAKKKIAWLHFDYGNPPRDDKLYLHYFLQCDGIVTVSERVNEALGSHLPQVADRCVEIDNINDPAAVRGMAEHGDTFTDGYTGLRVLTTARICDQKGQDMAIEALARLISDGVEMKWYFLGGGEQAEVDALMNRARELGIADRIVLLGTTDNPYTYLRDCDIFALTSRYEGKPITVEEAKMMCKPIMVTNYVSASEQLCGGEYGVIADISADGIYEGLGRLVRDEALRNSLSERLSRENFGNAEQIEKFYAMAE